VVLRLNGREVVPFWSSRSRIETVQKRHSKYATYRVSEISLGALIGEVLSQFDDEQIHVGVNWSGERLVGYDISAIDLRKNLQYQVESINRNR
jgi:Protein of unknown function (DUF2750)